MISELITTAIPLPTVETGLNCTIHRTVLWIFQDGNFVMVLTIIPIIFLHQQTFLPNGYVVVASDLAKFSAINPGVTNVVGGFGFDFDNGGEDLRLYTNADVLYTSVLYDDQAPWPLGRWTGLYIGKRIISATDPNDGNSWFAGCLGGSPEEPALHHQFQ